MSELEYRPRYVTALVFQVASSISKEIRKIIFLLLCFISAVGADDINISMQNKPVDLTEYRVEDSLKKYNYNKKLNLYTPQPLEEIFVEPQHLGFFKSMLVEFGKIFSIGSGVLKNVKEHIILPNVDPNTFPTNWDPITKEAIEDLPERFWKQILESKSPDQQQYIRERIFDEIEYSRKIKNSNLMGRAFGMICGWIATYILVLYCIPKKICAEMGIVSIRSFLSFSKNESVVGNIGMKLMAGICIGGLIGLSRYFSEKTYTFLMIVESIILADMFFGAVGLIGLLFSEKMGQARDFSAATKKNMDLLFSILKNQIKLDIFFVLGCVMWFLWNWFVVSSYDINFIDVVVESPVSLLYYIFGSIVFSVMLKNNSQNSNRSINFKRLFSFNITWALISYFVLLGVYGVGRDINAVMISCWSLYSIYWLLYWSELKE